MRPNDRHDPTLARDRDDISSNPTGSPPILEAVRTRLTRRGLLQSLAAGVAFDLFGGTLQSRPPARPFEFARRRAS